MSREVNKHHVIPKSRIEDGCDKDFHNVVLWDVNFHAKWHELFDNLTPREVHWFIDAITCPDTRWTKNDLARYKQKLVRSRPKIRTKKRGG